MKKLLPLLLLLPFAAVAEEKERFDWSGELMLSADYFEAVHHKDGEEDNSEATLRRGRLQFDYDFPKRWLGRIQTASRP